MGDCNQEGSNNVMIIIRIVEMDAQQIVRIKLILFVLEDKIKDQFVHDSFSNQYAGMGNFN